MTFSEKFPPIDPSPEGNPLLNTEQKEQEVPIMPGDRELDDEERAALAEVLKRARREDGSHN